MHMNCTCRNIQPFNFRHKQLEKQLLLNLTLISNQCKITILVYYEHYEDAESCIYCHSFLMFHQDHKLPPGTEISLLNVLDAVLLAR